MSGGKERAPRLDALREELGRRGLDGFVVPRADAHQGEFVPPHAERLAWLTGFTGSAGVAVVLSDRAAVFVDGRYTLQAREEVDSARFEVRHIVDDGPAAWIAERLGSGRLGYDPWLHTEDNVATLTSAAERAGGTLVALETNPLDAIWPDRPAPPAVPAVPHDLAHAGERSGDKRARIAEVLKAGGADAAVLTLPDSIAWLLNVRGSDIPHTPVVLSFAILHADGGVDWFVDPRKTGDALTAWLDDDVRCRDPEELCAALGALGAKAKRVLADPATAPAWVFARLREAGARIQRAADPVQRPKACKNETELAGSRAAHRRDGAAVARFLSWLSREGAARARANRPVTEMEAAEALLAERRRDPSFRDLAFETISGAGEHGAIVHYRVDDASDRPLSLGDLYLVDSGGQYLDATTDITRTVAVGDPSQEMRRHYTLVLKGHIALATVRFPKGTFGHQIDVLARHALWRSGLDYDHGTGHGVGSYLGVHEGPQRIAKRAGGVALEPGMICSNEPGYYKEGAYGIRIENLVAVVDDERPGDERSMLGFETLTLAPLCRALIDPGLLTGDEREWVNAYHARVREALLPLLDGEAADWVSGETAPL